MEASFWDGPQGGEEGEKVNEAMEKACCFLEVASTESGALVVVSGQG
jgi:hypothetical protein